MSAVWGAPLSQRTKGTLGTGTGKKGDTSPQAQSILVSSSLSAP